jgi:hypothetical protein
MIFSAGDLSVLLRRHARGANHEGAVIRTFIAFFSASLFSLEAPLLVQ